MVWKSLTSLVAGLMLANSVNAQESANVCQDSSVRTEVVDTLQVNHDDNRRLVSYKSENEGIRDIHGMLTNSNQEEAWIYSHRKWIEVGKNTDGTADDLELSLALDNQCIEKILKGDKQAILYHTHPDHPSFLGSIQTAFPSPEDYLVLVKTSQHSGSPQTHKIVHSFGVTEYSITEYGINNLNGFQAVFGSMILFRLAVDTAIQMHKADIQNDEVRPKSHYIVQGIEALGSHPNVFGDSKPSMIVRYISK